MKKTLLFVFLSFSVLALRAADIYDDVAAAIRSGNSKEVAGFFTPSVDLTILVQEGMYSKAQAEVIIRDFFAKNSPKSFSILHKGTSKEGSMYAIGNLQTTDGRIFRTYFFIKQISGKNFIQELRFEKE